MRIRTRLAPTTVRIGVEYRYTCLTPVWGMPKIHAAVASQMERLGGVLGPASFSTHLRTTRSVFSNRTTSGVPPLAGNVAATSDSLC